MKSLMFCWSWCQPVISWLSVWPQCSARPTVLQWVRSSPSVTRWRFLTFRPAGNTRLWTTKTASTSTCTQTTPPSAVLCWTSCSSTSGKPWRWCMRTQQVGRLIRNDTFISQEIHILRYNSSINFGLYISPKMEENKCVKQKITKNKNSLLDSWRTFKTNGTFPLQVLYCGSSDY